MVMGVCLRLFCLDGAFVCSEMCEGTKGCSGECCFGVMYVGWYSVCNFVVIPAVEVFFSYHDGVYVFLESSCHVVWWMCEEL